MKKNQVDKAEQAVRAAVLKEKAAAYVAGMEGEGKGVNFDRVRADRLLIVEALNDWSGGVLAEGENVHFTCSGADPACATVQELRELINRAHENPVLLYPVSGFLLSDEGDTLRYQQLDATYRLTPHSDGSRGSAIGVAEAKHVSDVEACHQLWLFCATEDCVAYLEHQMDAYGLQLEEQEDADVRRLVSGFLQEQFSPGQVWNAMWRSVKHAAALSKREYFNSTKAAKTIPKRIDKVLTKALDDAAFQTYDRPVDTPMGAVLMLFRQRFGVSDVTPGMRVREALAADAALAPAQEEGAGDDDAQFGEPPKTLLLQGTFHFSAQYTELDRIALSCFDDMQLDQNAPEWDAAGQLGCIAFSATDLYGFRGRAFFQAVCGQLGVDLPGEDEVAARVRPVHGDRWASETVRRELTTERLIAAGVGLSAARLLSWANDYPISPEDLVAILQGIPLPSGLVGMRVKYSRIDGGYSEHNDVIAAGEFAFAFEERMFEPEGDDQAIAASVANGDTNRVAKLLATAVARSIRCATEEGQAALLVRVAHELLDRSNRSPATS